MQIGSGRMLGRTYEDGHQVFSEPTPKRIRVRFGGEWIADSRRALILFETRHTPVYYLPREDVRFDLLAPTDHTTHCPYKGDASYWSVTAGGRTAENAVWAYPEPLEGQAHLADYVAFYWHLMDQWFEEDEEVFVHARDPYKRIDILPSSRHVQVYLGDTVVAESRRPVFLYETGLPVRTYLPQADVRLDLLEPTDSTTSCPYKGNARYWTAVVDGERYEDIAWSYPFPTRESQPIAGLVCFYDERVTRVVMDGEEQERPQTRWSR